MWIALSNLSTNLAIVFLPMSCVFLLSRLFEVQIIQIADHHVKDLAAEAVEVAQVDVTMDEVEAVEGMVYHFESAQARRDDRHQSVIGEVH